MNLVHGIYRLAEWEDIFTGHTVPPTTKGEYKQKLATSDAECTVMYEFVILHNI